jgi:hypothetical protein
MKAIKEDKLWGLRLLYPDHEHRSEITPVDDNYFLAIIRLYQKRIPKNLF